MSANDSGEHPRGHPSRGRPRWWLYVAAGLIVLLAVLILVAPFVLDEIIVNILGLFTNAYG